MGLSAEWSAIVLKTMISLRWDKSVRFDSRPAILSRGNMISVQNSVSFTCHLPAGNPLAQTVQVTADLEEWTVVNSSSTSWIHITPNAGFGNAFFSVSVNAFDSSVVPGVQTGVLLLKSPDPTVTITVTLTVYTT